MNKQIQELAEQAGAKFPFGGFVNYDQFDCEKFAESIVRECAQFVFVLDSEPISHQSAARLLQEHFGVE